MVAEITQKINAVVSKHMAPLLKSFGFKRYGQCFRKCFFEHTWVVEVQRDKYNSGKTGEFTVNLAVYHPKWIIATEEVPRACRVLTDEPHAYQCLINERLDFLVTGRPGCWEVNESVTIEQIGTEVAEALAKHGIPWLEAMSPLQAAVSALTDHFIRLQGAWPYKTMAMFGWVALGQPDQAALLYAAACGDVVTAEEMERDFGDWGRKHGVLPART